eukprot:TRINITY_DN32101_c0_g1_i1.p1 TRINITY_DN32101_c0_g1~~TRINITY_DN32101_c0_g1_i1.p1  ORF type:complete len:485 (+),score=177.21 TRINITY_DN32101_c0_g1_i1:64-1518(+)
MGDAFEQKIGDVREYVEREWDATVIPTLCEYIKVDNQSPSYDDAERKNGKTEAAFKLLLDWVEAQQLERSTMHYLEQEGRTPFLLVEIEAAPGCEGKKTCMVYGHMDKQPPLDNVPPGWDEGLGPYKPVIRDGKLYGRGGADDGYAVCAAVVAIKALQLQALPHGRIVVVIEACEESGSFDLPFYLEKCRDMIQDVDLVVCLDSGALEYDTMYVTQSLRGVMGGRLNVSLLTEGMHSGLGGGIVPDSFQIARRVLSRLEDQETGEVKCKELHADVPQEIIDGFKFLDEREDKLISGPVPIQPGVRFEEKESVLALRNTWMPAVTVVGADGLPACRLAGNVLRQSTSLMLSIRLPPTIDPGEATEAVQKLLTANPPHGAKVSFTPDFSGPGWKAPTLAPWCSKLFAAASQSGFGRTFAAMGCGGSIPFMGMLGDMYPEAQFCITGVLGPKSNAHGPNEFLHLDFAKKLTVSVSHILHGHAAQGRE